MGNIRVIGPRSSGKTTYLAALAQWSTLQKGLHLESFAVQAIGEDSKKLAKRAEGIIRQSLSLTPNDIQGGIYAMPIYQFQIRVKHLLPKPRTDVINLVVKDYAGEIFNDLALGVVRTEHEEFIQDCLMNDVEGCLILVSEWKKGSDNFYEQAMQNFLRQVDRYVSTENRKAPLRLAIAMSKCERGELWPGRLDPEIDLFNVHLPRMKAALRRRISPQHLRFFALSTFGVLERNDPRPNRVDEMGRDGTHSVLREPTVWQPFGMLAPLHWLSTGKMMRTDA